MRSGGPAKETSETRETHKQIDLREMNWRKVRFLRSA